MSAKVDADCGKSRTSKELKADLELSEMEVSCLILLCNPEPRMALWAKAKENTDTEEILKERLMFY